MIFFNTLGIVLFIIGAIMFMIGVFEFFSCIINDLQPGRRRRIAELEAWREKERALTEEQRKQREEHWKKSYRP
jgi:hypothetical protein